MLTLQRLSGFGIQPQSLANADPNLAALTLAVTGKGAHGDTPTADLTGKALSWVGDAKLSNAVTLNYATSLQCDGAGDVLGVAAGAGLAFGDGDFTIRLKFRHSATSFGFPLSMYNGTAMNTWYMDLNNGGAAGRLRWAASGVAFDFGDVAPPGTWHDIEISRGGGVLRCFIGGVLRASAADSTNYTVTGPLWIGGDGHSAAQHTAMNVQDLLIYKGVSLHTADFAPPTVGYADAYA